MEELIPEEYKNIPLSSDRLIEIFSKDRNYPNYTNSNEKTPQHDAYMSILKAHLRCKMTDEVKPLLKQELKNYSHMIGFWYKVYDMPCEMNDIMIEEWTEPDCEFHKRIKFYYMDMNEKIYLEKKKSDSFELLNMPLKTIF